MIKVVIAIATMAVPDRTGISSTSISISPVTSNVGEVVRRHTWAIDITDSDWTIRVEYYYSIIDGNRGSLLHPVFNIVD